MTRLKKFKTSLDSNIVHPLGPARLLVKANHQWIPSNLDFMAGVAPSPQEMQTVTVVPPTVSLTNRSVAPIDVAVDASTMTVPFQQRFHLKVWLDALQMLSILLYNTCFCVAFTWFTNWVFSRGNILTRRTAAEQSDFEFFAGTFSRAFDYVLDCAHHSNASADAISILKPLKHKITTFVPVLPGPAFATYSADILAIGGAPELYACCLLVHVYVAGITIAVRRIFQHETMEDQCRYSPGNENSPTRYTSFWKSVAFFARAYVRGISKVVPVCCAGLHIQLVSQSTVTGTWSFVAYTIGSLLLKTIVKEIAKIGIVKFKVRDPRSIFVVFGLPTVLIDTQWKRQMLALQIAESYASMSAEYIAIGCSTSISYFYWDHPKYESSGRHNATPSPSFPGYQTPTFIIQIVVEICVDYVSCVLEIAQGLQFQEVRKYRRFLGLLFVSIATINVQICAMVYFQAQ
ncbi:hypothetical protein FI667_g8124, partial [Globisporangium splendens]